MIYSFVHQFESMECDVEITQKNGETSSIISCGRQQGSLSLMMSLRNDLDGPTDTASMVFLDVIVAKQIARMNFVFIVCAEPVVMLILWDLWK